MGGFRRDKQFMEKSMQALKVRNVEVPSVYFSVSSDVILYKLHLKMLQVIECRAPFTYVLILSVYLT